MSPAAKKYYAGGIRFVRDGVPCRMASWVNDLTPLSRDSLIRGSKIGYRPDNHDYAGGGIAASKRAIECQARHPQTTYLPLEAFQ